MTSDAAVAVSPEDLQRQLRRVLGSYPTGVTVITTRDAAGDPVGMTANSFASVSLNPPLILWSVSRTALGFEAYSGANHFGINILAEDQADISNRFAKAGEDKFAEIKTTTGIGGIPMIESAAAQIECQTWTRYDGGDHLIIIGEAKAFRRWDRRPLLFVNGRYGKLQSGTVQVPDADWPISFW